MKLRAVSLLVVWLVSLRVLPGQDIGFRPDPDGYQFSNSNFGLTYFPIEDMRRMFGDSIVCWKMIGSTCIPRKDMEKWNLSVNWYMFWGHCDGFTSTSLRFFRQVDKPSSYGAATTYGLVQSGDVRRNIAYYQALNFANPIHAAQIQSLQQTPKQVFDKLQSNMSSGANDPLTLILFKGKNGTGGGHSVTPYAVVDRGGGTYWVRVYDNNHPGDQLRYVEIKAINPGQGNEQSTWSYSSILGDWSGDNTTHSLGGIPMSTYAQPAQFTWAPLSGSTTGTLAQTWTASGLNGQNIMSVTIDPVNPAIIYAGSNRSGVAGEVFKTTNGGASWMIVADSLSTSPVLALAIDPSDSSTIYAGTSNVFSAPMGVLKSTNGGASWSNVLNGRATSISIDPINPATVYAAMGDRFRVAKTTDGGSTWQESQNLGYWVSAVAVDARHPNIIYAGTRYGGVVRSTDSGGNWTPINNGLTGQWLIRSLGIDPQMPIVYAGTDDAGIFKLSVTTSVWLNGSGGHLLITDPQGRKIGFAGNQFVSEIPGAFGYAPPGGTGTPVEPIYTLPRINSGYSLLLDGQTITQPQLTTVSQFGQQYAVSLDSINLQSSSRDNLTIAADGTQASYHSSDTKLLTVTLTLVGDSQSYDFQIVRINVAAGQTITATINSSQGKLFVNGSQISGGALESGGSSTYAVNITRLNETGTTEVFAHSEINLTAGDTHSFNYSSWSNTGPMTMQIDHGSTGTTIETRVLTNQAAKIFLPLIFK